MGAPITSDRVGKKELSRRVAKAVLLDLAKLWRDANLSRQRTMEIYVAFSKLCLSGRRLSDAPSPGEKTRQAAGHVDE